MGRIEDWVRRGGTRRLVALRLFPIALLLGLATTIIIREETPEPEPQAIVLDEQLRPRIELHRYEPIVLNAIPTSGLSDGAAITASQVVPLSVVINGVTQPLGSGVLLSPDMLLTAAHVLPPSEQFPIVDVSCGGLKRPAKIIGRNDILDLAALETNCPANKIEFDDTPLEIDDQLLVSRINFIEMPGLPLAARRELLLTSPIPAAVLKLSLDIETILDQELFEIYLMLESMKAIGADRHQAIAGALIKGNSGSPVLRPNGDIVGIGVISHYGLGRSYIVPASSILPFLRTVRANQKRNSP